MIEGLNIKVSSVELGDLLDGRIQHHTARVELYTRQIKALAAEGETIEQTVNKFTNASNSPVATLDASRKSHQKKITYFDFLRNHLIPDEEYSLDIGDLNTLEITSY